MTDAGYIPLMRAEWVFLNSLWASDAVQETRAAKLSFEFNLTSYEAIVAATAVKLASLQAPLLTGSREASTGNDSLREPSARLKELKGTQEQDYLLGRPDELLY